LIEDFVIDHPGTCPPGTSLAAGTCPNSSTNYLGYQGQGDGIDVKNGVTYLTIQHGEIAYCPSNGINVPLTATNVDQHILIQRVNIHDGILVPGNGGNRAIYAGTGGATETTQYGIVGLTIRNCIIAKHNFGISIGGGGTQPVNQAFVYNNTLYGCPQGNLYVGGGAGTNDEVKNNFSFASLAGDFVGPSVVSDYNAHDGTWTSANEGPHKLVLSTTQALAAVVNATGEDFHPSVSSVLIGKALTISSFSDDFYGILRASAAWDIAAVQSGSVPAAASVVLAPPSNLQVVVP
jgi:hypothetical protein